MSENINENEQWKLSGNCDKCKRQEYCSKHCTKKKKRDNYQLAATIDATLYKVMGRLYR